MDEVRRGVAETLRTQFEPSTELFRDGVRRLIEDPNWIKGPYVQLGMPFVSGSQGKGFFPDFKTEHPAFLHQEQAWRRCGVRHASTLVATGTGSGKTECFLYPILEHAARERHQHRPGIKAIIIYPMNALADDQAKRIAELVHATPAFAGLRVVEHLIADDETVLRAIRPRAFARPQEAVARVLPAFFTDPEVLAALLAGIDTPLGRVRLGEELKKHLLFQSLLRTATQAPVTVAQIADKIHRTLSARLVPEARALVRALLTLVAWARAPHAGQEVGCANAGREAEPPGDPAHSALAAGTAPGPGHRQPRPRRDRAALRGRGAE